MSDAGAATLERLADVGPWPAVSGLVGYDGRVWFVNSVKFRNHNSADLYSYDPGAGGVRYERHLFSQDAGEPLVHDGLLYWPAEDPRWSAGRAEYMVTDGTNWSWAVVPEGRAFHLHAMGTTGGALYAAISAWRARLARSVDAGRRWRLTYEHPTPEGRVSRITSLAALDGTLYGGSSTYYRAGPNLLRLSGDDLGPVKAWPVNLSTTELTPWRGWLYALIETDEGTGVARYDGETVEPVTALDGAGIVALAAGSEALWGVATDEGDGMLWRSDDGVSWTRVQTLPGAQPIDVAVVAGAVYVGAIGPGETGSLWGPPSPVSAPPPAPPRALPIQAPLVPPEAVADELRRLDTLLKDPDAYRWHADRIRVLLQDLASTRLPMVGAALEGRLRARLPGGTVDTFGGQLASPRAEMARWYLMRALALNGHGRVPSTWIGLAWSEKANGAEKYFALAPGAAWAAARLGQADDETLGALMARLDRDGDPPWLVGDIVGALTALTGERFGYDVAAWRRWWSERRAEQAH